MHLPLGEESITTRSVSEGQTVPRSRFGLGLKQQANERRAQDPSLTQRVVINATSSCVSGWSGKISFAVHVKAPLLFFSMILLGHD